MEYRCKINLHKFNLDGRCVCACVIFDWYQMKCLQKSKNGRKEKAIYAPMLPNSNYRKHTKKNAWNYTRLEAV